MADLPPLDAIQSKGFTLLGPLSWVRENHGDDGLKRLMAVLPAELAKAIRHGVISAAWYPFHHQVALYSCIDSLFGRDDGSLIIDIGRYNVGHELETVHRMLTRFSTLDLWLNMASRMWGMYYSHGRLSIENFAEESGDAVVRDFNPGQRVFCRNFTGWLEGLIWSSGKTNVVIRHPECVLAGGQACLFTATFTEPAA